MKKVVIENGKTYIPGIPRMSWETGEMCEFASAFIRAVRCFDCDVDYNFITGVSGTAFRFVLDEKIWNPGNYGIQNFTADPLEPISASFESVGMTYKYYDPSTFVKDRNAIVSSLENGIPVIAFGVVGPSDAVIITGFDDEGDTLLGWSTFQNIPDDHNIPHDSTGYFRKPGWHENIRGYIIINPVKQKVDKHEIAKKALKRIVRGMECKNLPGRICGIEALSSWEAALRNNDNFDIDTETYVWRYLCFTINTTMLLDQLSAPYFIIALVQEIPECKKLLQDIAEMYKLNAEVIKKARRTIPDDFSINAQENLMNKCVRIRYAEFIHEIRYHTEDACEKMKTCIEQLQ